MTTRHSVDQNSGLTGFGLIFNENLTCLLSLSLSLLIELFPISTTCLTSGHWLFCDFWFSFFLNCWQQIDAARERRWVCKAVIWASPHLALIINNIIFALYTHTQTNVIRCMYGFWSFWPACSYLNFNWPWPVPWSLWSRVCVGWSSVDMRPVKFVVASSAFWLSKKRRRKIFVHLYSMQSVDV